MRTLYQDAHLMGQEGSYDLLVADGKFEAVAPHIEAEAECVDLGGQLVIPPYVEPHIHLDAVYAGGRNGTGTLFEGIRRWSEVKASYTEASIRARALAAIRAE
ncbi:cytosine deaminase, partial [Selenomonas bovis]|nr:cytosine deaminase [Selenomonas bovis]